MSEFRVHTLVAELIGLLKSPYPPEKFIDKVEKGVAPSESIPSKLCVRYLEKHASNPQEFLNKYEELKSKKVDRLGSFMQVLYHISADKQLKDYLSKQSLSLGNITTELDPITSDDLPQIQKKIIKAALEDEKKKIQQVNALTKKLESTTLKNNWVSERPRISWDFQSDTLISPYQKVVPVVSQESILLWDIFSCLKGIDGSYIVSETLTHPYAMKTFKISADVGISYKQLAQQILPLASCYSMTVRFVEEKVQSNDGQVNHALVGAISCLLKDYMMFILQLEMEHRKGKLNLQKLWFYIHPTMSTMSILSQITSTICKVSFTLFFIFPFQS